MPFDDGAMTRHDAAERVACEHIVWCQSASMTPRQVVEALGGKGSSATTWDDAFVAVAIAWMNLRRNDEFARNAA